MMLTLQPTVLASYGEYSSPVVVVAACELIPDHHHGDAASDAYEYDTDAVLGKILSITRSCVSMAINGAARNRHTGRVAQAIPSIIKGPET